MKQSINQQISNGCDVSRSVSNSNILDHEYPYVCVRARAFCEIRVESFGGQAQTLRKYEDSKSSREFSLL